MLGRLIQPEIRELIKRRDLRTLRDVLVELSVAHAAEALSDFTDGERALAFRVLPKERAADVFEQFEPPDQEALLSSLKDAKAAAILNEMDPDDRTELLEEMPDRVARRVMRLLSPAERAVTQALLAYPEDSVGRLMTPDYVKVKSHLTVAEVLDHLRRIGDEKETVYYIYIVDERNVPLAVVSLRELIFADQPVKVGDLPDSEDELVKIRATEDQEEAVQILRHYDLMVLPVVDSAGRLVGIVTVDDLMDVQEEEATEDMELMSGVVPTERGYLHSNFLTLLRSRLGALTALAIMATLMGSLLHDYESGMEGQFSSLVGFIIVLMAASGNTGSQAGTLVIRALATEDIGPREGIRVATRELGMGALLGFALGVVVAITGYLFPGNIDVTHAIVVGFSLSIAVWACNMVGVLLPLGLHALKLDPAYFATPAITTIADVLAIVVFFEIAKACLT